MKTVFLHEMKSNRKSILSWSLAMTAVCLFFLSVYPAYASGAEELKKLLTGFPPAILKAMSFEVDVIFSPLGFYGFIFTYIVLCGSIGAMILGTQAIAKEFNRKTADFLFTKPVSRSGIMTGKLLAGILSVFITDAVVIGFTYPAARIIVAEPLDFGLFMRLSATLFFIGMMFFALGFLAAVIFQRIKAVLGVSIGTVFGFFIAGMLGKALEDEKIRYLVPFQYYEPISIVREQTYEPVFVWINILFVAGAIALSFLIYTKRDIHSV